MAPQPIANMADQTPREIVTSKCIAYTEALLQYRQNVITASSARQVGEDMFRWFEGVGALENAKASIAARCVDLGITRLKTSPDTEAAISAEIRSSYSVYG